VVRDTRLRFSGARPGNASSFIEQYIGERTLLTRTWNVGFGGRDATENEPTENEPTENEPTENEPTENEPTENEPTENEPTGEVNYRPVERVYEDAARFVEERQVGWARAAAEHTSAFLLDSGEKATCREAGAGHWRRSIRSVEQAEKDCSEKATCRQAQAAQWWRSIGTVEQAENVAWSIASKFTFLRAEGSGGNPEIRKW
jgi:hypothetical protein